MATVAPARRNSVVAEAYRLMGLAARAEKKAPAQAPEPAPKVKKPTKAKGRAK